MRVAFHLEKNFDSILNKTKVMYVVFKKEKLLFNSESMALPCRFAPIFPMGQACLARLLCLKNKSRYLQKGCNPFLKKVMQCKNQGSFGILNLPLQKYV
jgi:hypothetical protein